MSGDFVKLKTTSKKLEYVYESSDFNNPYNELDLIGVYCKNRNTFYLINSLRFHGLNYVVNEEKTEKIKVEHISNLLKEVKSELLKLIWKNIEENDEFAFDKIDSFENYKEDLINSSRIERKAHDYYVNDEDEEVNMYEYENLLNLTRLKEEGHIITSYLENGNQLLEELKETFLNENKQNVIKSLYEVYLAKKRVKDFEEDNYMRNKKEMAKIFKDDKYKTLSLKIVKDEKSA